MLGRFPALAGADLEVEAGEIVLLAGANGAGKTTLLRLCAGLLPLRSGHAEVLGVDLAVDRRAMRRSLALVGHETFCYDDLTVQENIRFATRAAGRSVADADAALERLGLGRASRASRTAASHRDSGAVSRSRSRSRETRASCSSTNRTPGSTSRAAPCSTTVVRAAPAEGRTVLLASHELDVARQVATREIRIAAGSGARGAGEPRRPDPRPGRRRGA